MQDMTNVIEKFKKQPFAKGLLPFRAAVRSLSTPYPRIYAHKEGRQRWVIYDKLTREPAIFSHAAIFAESDDLDTGNFVPHGQIPPLGVDTKSMQHRPNQKCFYTYIFDTFADLSLYEGQWSLDDYMRDLEGFNPTNLPRRPYLSGQDPRFRTRFWMQTPVFLRRGPQETRSAAPSHLHPWIVQADHDSKVFRANTDRPRVWMKVGDSIVPIAERSPAGLQRGDAIAVSFTVTYHMSSVNWFAQFHPADLVVVKEGDNDATDYSAPSLGLYSRPPPSFNPIPEEDSYMADVEDSGQSSGAVEAEAKSGNVTGGAAGDKTVETYGPIGDVGLTESMEVDESASSPTESSGSGSGASLAEAVEEGFDVVDVGEADAGHLLEEYVDVMAEEEQKRGPRAGSGRAGRVARKRN